MRRALKTKWSRRGRRGVIIVERDVGFASNGIGILIGVNAGKAEQTQDTARIRVIVRQDRDERSRQVQEIINVSGQSAACAGQHETISVRRIKRNVRCRRAAQRICGAFAVHPINLELTTSARLLIGIIIQNVAVGLAEANIGSANQKPESLVEAVVPRDNVHRHIEKITVNLGPIAKRSGGPEAWIRRRWSKDPIGFAAEVVVRIAVGSRREVCRSRAKVQMHPAAVIAVIEIVGLSPGHLLPAEHQQQKRS